MGLENIEKAAKKAREAGIFERLINDALRIAALEVEENVNCPVPDCLAVLLEEATLKNKPTAVIELARVLDLRDQYFSHPNEEPVIYLH